MQSCFRRTGWGARPWAWSVLLAGGMVAGVLVVGLRFLGAEPDKPNPNASSPLPALQVDRKTAPRLEEVPEKPSAPQGTPKKRADNSACYVCHGNYDGETLETVHAEANVGCVQCHGESLGHRNDEAHRTPPEIMYPAEKIEAACQTCHDTHDVSAKKVLARWRQKCPTKTDPDQLVCTDCHGEHRLPRREVVWDKRTGKLQPLKNSSSSGSGGR